MTPVGFWWDVASQVAAGVAVASVLAIAVAARRIATWMIIRTLRRAGPKVRAEYEPEWLSEISNSSRRTAVRFAFGLWWRADLVSVELRSSSSTTPIFETRDALAAWVADNMASVLYLAREGRGSDAAELLEKIEVMYLESRFEESPSWDEVKRAHNVFSRRDRASKAINRAVHRWRR